MPDAGAIGSSSRERLSSAIAGDPYSTRAVTGV